MYDTMIPPDRFIRNDDGKPVKCDICVSRLAERVYMGRIRNWNLCDVCDDFRAARRAELEAV